MVRRVATLAAALTWAGCHVVLPLSDGQDLRVLDAQVGDGARDGVVLADLSADGAGPAPTLTFSSPASPDLPIGGHQVLAMSVSPPGTIGVRLTARPCLLKREGQGAGPVDELDVALPGSAGLVVFAPPAAPLGATCTLAAVGNGKVQPLTFTVKAPGYVVATIGSGQGISMVEGMAVTTVGEISVWQPVQALTYADGSFGGAWIAAAGASGDTLATPSTVTFYRFDAKGGGPSVWVDLVGKKTSPTAVEDMIWSPAGPCPMNSDALYIAGPGADAPIGAGDAAGGIYCLGSNKTMSTIADNQGRALDVDADGLFHPPLAKGTLLVSRWGGHYVYPPGDTFSDSEIPNVANLFRFARLGPFKGNLYAVASGTALPYPLTRVTPSPHKATTLADLQNANASVALCHGGAFGELVVVTDESPTYALFDVTALFEEPGQVRELSLVRSLPCGRRIAFDAAGLHLAVTTAGTSSSCKGPSAAHLFTFPLP